MSEMSFTNFFNNAQAFGMNIRVPEKTMQQIGKTGSNVAGGVFEPIVDYFEQNDNVFSGDITKEFNKVCSEKFNYEIALATENEKVNGPRPSFEAMF